MRKDLIATGIIGALAFLLGTLLLLGVAGAIEIDTCTTFFLFNSSNGTGYPMDICPKISYIKIENVTLDSVINGTNGTCVYNISGQSKNVSLPYIHLNGTLPSNGSVFFNLTDRNVAFDYKSDMFYCPICPIPQICSVSKTDTYLLNESYTWTVQSEYCDINFTVPARPYCLSDDTQWLMNNTCLERTTLGNLLQQSNETTELSAKLKIYEATWMPQKEACKIMPLELANGWEKLSKWERDKLPLFAAMGAAPVKLETFANNAMPSSSNPDEINNNMNLARMALENYRIVGFADYWRENVTMADGKAYPQVIGYKTLIQEGCISNNGSIGSLVEYGKQEKGNGWWAGITLAIIGVGILILLIYTLIDMNRPE
jgi:hypothetical protein